MSHNFTVPALVVRANVLPSGLKRTEEDDSGRIEAGRISLPVARLQSFTVPSVLADASDLPSDEKVRKAIGPGLPLSGGRSLPVAASHILSESLCWKESPVANTWLSGV